MKRRTNRKDGLKILHKILENDNNKLEISDLPDCFKEDLEYMVTDGEVYYDLKDKFPELYDTSKYYNEVPIEEYHDMIDHNLNVILSDKELIIDEAYGFIDAIKHDINVIKNSHFYDEDDEKHINEEYNNIKKVEEFINNYK